MALFDIRQDAGGDSIDTHFDDAARNASSEELGAGLAAAMRSDQTPPFGNMVGHLFGQSSSDQRAGLLNQILATLGPAVASGLGSGILGRLLRPGQHQITPDQASQITPAEATEIAEHAQQQHPGIIDEVGRFYAQHSGLVKTLGGAALAIALAQMKNRSR
ncbi:MAG: hypothetical protein ABIR26_13990 [Ramlibacter sp.]